MRAFYIAQPDMRVPRTGEKIVVGETVSVDRCATPRLLNTGLHASVHVLDTLLSRSVGCLTLVDVTGDLVEGEDMICGRSRTTIAALLVEQTGRLLREIACAIAELALQWGCYDLGLEPDQRSVDAIDVARRFARGRATPRELDDARHAANDAAAWAPAAIAVGLSVCLTEGHEVRDTVWITLEAAESAAAEYVSLDATRQAARAACHDIADRMALDALGGAP